MKFMVLIVMRHDTMIYTPKIHVLALKKRLGIDFKRFG